MLCDFLKRAITDRLISSYSLLLDILSGRQALPIKRVGVENQYRKSYPDGIFPFEAE
jgi:hypothetical protein